VTIVRRGATLQWKNKSRELWLRDDMTVSRGLEEMVMAFIVAGDVRR
jgi:hypothetical protein